MGKTSVLGRPMLALVSVLLVLPALLVAGCAGGGDGAYPNQTIQVIIPYSAGGGTDRTARVHGGTWGTYAEVPVRVVDMPGGGAADGMRYVAEAEPDGYTIMGMGYDILTTPLVRDIGVTLESFVPICSTADYGWFVVVPADSPFETFEEFATYVDEHPDELTYASFGAGSASHFGMELVLKNAGDLQMKHVPLEGGAQQIAQLMGGHVDAACVTTATGLPTIVSGDIRALANTDRERHPDVPDVPTLRDIGIDVDYLGFRAYFAPAGTDQERVEALEAIFQQVVQDEGNIALVQKLGERPIFVGSEEFEEWLYNQREMLLPIVESVV